MKPLAILKDSIRESWDSKILLVLLIISTLFSVFLASIGYQPQPASEMLDRVGRDFGSIVVDRGQLNLGMNFPSMPVNASVSDFTEITPASNPANGEYSFKIKFDPALGKGGNSLTNFQQPRNVEPTNVDPANQPKDDPEGKDAFDAFQASRILWSLKRDEFFKLSRNSAFSPEDKKRISLEALNALTPEEYVKIRLNYHYNIEIKSVERKAGPDKGIQEFTVVTAKSDPRNWPHRASLFFGALSFKSFPPPTALGQIVYVIQNYLINGVGAGIALMLGIIVTSFFIPNMMRKGSIDLMLSKPINRVSLLIYKYVGGLSFMFIFSAVTVGSVWLVFGLTSGLWNPKFLLLIPLWTYAFGVLYAFSTLVSVWTRSAIASLLLTLGAHGLLWLLGFVYVQIDVFRNNQMFTDAPSWLYPTADAINSVLPRTRDLDTITTKLIADVMTENDQQKMGINTLTTPSITSTLGVSFAWIAGMLSLACWRFSKKDY